ncbi:DUF5343 domain-containing protein [Agreia sp. Leaf335]|uniref:DUF5343 domain-containing protein n=1 Tax=Agreia sp. Leaf335 TaxID=1736340 RepID=UPI000B25399C|nr:DUF5343 domain-containing protein [Agreia sp. Leaf335]
MATYPYTSGQGALVKAFEQFRKAFPPVLDASTLKRFNIAPANESYVINIYRFLGLIDDEGKKVDGTTDLFFHGEDEFRSGLEGLIQTAYADLFADHGATAWDESRDTLATWFRVKDKTSDLIGGRQASTFLTLAALAGHGDPVRPSISTKPAASPKPVVKKVNKSDKADSTSTSGPGSVSTNPSTGEGRDDIGLTVRIEVNLPAAGTADVYDAIFASIRKNLIDRA